MADPVRLGAGLAAGAEFDRIRRLLKGHPAMPPYVRMGPGDDAAVLDVSSLVVSTDLSIEDIHYRRAWLNLEEIGYRAVACALSDLAAMAAAPLGVLTSIGLARQEGNATLDALASGIHTACASFKTPLLGGDLSASPGPLILDVTVLGQAAAPTLRSGALPGDQIWVTGTLGASAAAVSLWEGGSDPPPPIRQAFVQPIPRLNEARWLAQEGVPRAMIDLSDGLTGDVGHLAAASGVSVTIDAWSVPVDAGVEDHLGPEESSELACSGGEDYELCFAARAGSVQALVEPFQDRFGLRLTQVGTVGQGSGVTIRSAAGAPARAAGRGFNHFEDGQDS